MEIASVPPPVTPTPTPTPTPTAGTDLPTGTVTYTYPSTDPVHVRVSWLDSPATRAGTSDMLGRLVVNPGTGESTLRTISPGEFTMGISSISQGLQYTLNAPAGVLPGTASTISVRSPMISWDINSTVAYRYTNPYGDTPQYLGQRLVGENELGTQLFSYDFTRGVTGTSQPYGTGTSLSSNLVYDIGLSYVAMGEWSWSVVDTNGVFVPASARGQLLFVNGDRTPASAIPVSGTATYDARTLNGSVKVPFALTADFGERTISTRIDQDYAYNSNGDIMDDPLAIGIHVAGAAPFGNDGSFDIPLTGTVNIGVGYAINPPETPPSQAASGDMNGAFFGPHAEQVGGTFSLQKPGDLTLLLQDAFVGQQHH